MSRQEVVGPELTMTEAPAVAGVAGCRVAFGDGSWMWGGIRERKNRTSSWVRCRGGCGAEVRVLSEAGSAGGHVGDNELGCEGETQLGPCWVCVVCGHLRKAARDRPAAGKSPRGVSHEAHADTVKNTSSWE